MTEDLYQTQEHEVHQYRSGSSSQRCDMAVGMYSESLRILRVHIAPERPRERTIASMLTFL